jgi:hypothetical protein
MSMRWVTRAGRQPYQHADPHRLGEQLGRRSVVGCPPGGNRPQRGRVLTRELQGLPQRDALIVRCTRWQFATSVAESKHADLAKHAVIRKLLGRVDGFA